MLKRTLFAIPALALLFSVVYFGGLFARIVVAAAGVLCMHEMLRMVAADSKPVRTIGYVFSALSFPVYEYLGGFEGVAMLFLVSVMAVLITLVLTGRTVKDGFMTMAPLAYPGMFFLFLIAITCVGDVDVYRFLMIIAFGAAIVTDSFAYFTGRLIGKHKLAEAISPKKTVEGAVGGAVFGIAAVYLFGYLGQEAFGVNIPAFWYALLGALLTVLSQLGDLAASKVKRCFNAKDYGKIMGAHGGAMDRLDSLLFVVPAVYGFYSILF